MVYLVPLTMVDQIYPRVADELKRAIDYHQISGWTTASLYGACRSGQVYLFVDDLIDPKNAATVQFVVWGGMEQLYVMFLAGKGGMDWRTEMRHLRDFAKVHGVTRIIANTRDGLLKQIPHKKLATLVEILEDEQ